MINTKLNVLPIMETSLARHKIWSIEGDRRGYVIHCCNGTLWITQEGDLKDYLIEAGKDFWVTRRGEVVVQAMENSQFKYSLNELDTHIEVNSQPPRRRSLARFSNHLR
ncbi:MAG: DUF2917 domain-containing protein [Acidobacteriaceae bacterium]